MTRRYICKDIEPDPCGDFVHHEDHAAALASIDQLTRERDEALALVAERDATVGRLSLECYYEKRDVVNLKSRLNHIQSERDEARARVAELSAPPVVPEGWSVEWRDRMWQLRDTVPGRDLQSPPLALEALAFARRTGMRPPHAGDSTSD